MDYTDALPASNRTTQVMAAVFNRLAEASSSVVAVPNKRQCNDPREDPPYIRTFSLLEISGLSIDRAVEIDSIIHDRVMVAKWGDYADEDTRVLGYRWKCLTFDGCTLLTRQDGDPEQEYRVIHPILFYADSDVDLILNFSENPFHRRKYAALGIAQVQMDLSTYDWGSISADGSDSRQWAKRRS
jgi:hypothetical protein